ncbi:hypothetical protein D3C85_1715980 [compost metagenome]
MSSPHYVRTFLSGELLVGVKRSDPHGIQHIKRHQPSAFPHKQVRPVGRYLSEEASTYLC